MVSITSLYYLLHIQYYDDDNEFIFTGHLINVNENKEMSLYSVITMMFFSLCLSPFSVSVNNRCLYS